jgi:hypothetical protein
MMVYEDGICAGCGCTVDDYPGLTEEDKKEFQEKGWQRLECPGCGRDGCLCCIPGGNNCLCPDCDPDGDY